MSPTEDLTHHVKLQGIFGRAPAIYSPRVPATKQLVVNDFAIEVQTSAHVQCLPGYARFDSLNSVSQACVGGVAAL